MNVRHFIEYENHILVHTLADGDRDQEVKCITQKLQKIYPNKKIDISNFHVEDWKPLETKKKT